MTGGVGVNEMERRGEVPIERVEASPFRVRMVMDLTAIRQIEADARGLTSVAPVVVWERTEAPGRYVVLDGERRRRVALRAGLKKLPVLIRPVLDARDAEVQTLVAGLIGFQATPVAEGEAVA